MTQAQIRQWLPAIVGSLLGLVVLTSCRELTGNQALPAGTQNPAYYNTPAGAVSMWNAAMYELEQAIPVYITDAGLLTDELESNATGASAGTLLESSLPPGGSIDERILPELTTTSGPTDADYGNLQAVRGNVDQAVGALLTYDTAANTPVLRGELYALEGYAEILLADFFCSGVPLSTLDYQKDYTYRASSTTQQLYQDAIAKEDTALLLASSNDTIQSLAQLLQGRAFLALGEYPQAGQAVAVIPQGFQYQLAIQWDPTGNGNILNQSATVSDREGVNGLPYRSNGDPRTAVTLLGTNSSTGTPLYFPNKYSSEGYSQFMVADWIEARLIQAEAALQSTPTVPNASAIALLNTLRAPYITADSLTAIPTSGLTWTQQVDTLFAERAAWLFLTGHRQGDLRRLVREYGQSQAQVYPVGTYNAPGANSYGSDVNAPIPAQEYANPLFHGCLNRD